MATSRLDQATPDPVLSRPPANDAAAGDHPQIVEQHEEEHPTASHALAEEALSTETEEQGVSQMDHDHTEVKNLGWNDEGIPKPLVGGIENEELWTLMRRFNKQVFHVKSIEEPPLANLDMNIADGEEFSPEKLRAQLERMYMVVLVSLLSFWKHIVRLRSWREQKRTWAFLGVYALAWLLDILVPTIVGFLMVLIVYPPTRSYCFPPAPPSLIDSNTGGLQKPPAGVLGSDDTMTGAPEKHEGEAVEQEAHSFVTSISTVCSGLVISTAAGKHPQGDPEHDKSTNTPDPTEITADVAHAKDKSNGDEPTHEHDRTKEPVSRAVWSQARPVMHAMADFVDTWERFGNALNATPPFPRQRPRLTLAACLLPVLVGSYLTTSYMLLRGISFAVGFGFFGDPIMTPAIQFLHDNVPNWPKYLELRHTVLRGIPTNVQLVVTLLRIGEKNQAPIPPPPSSDVPPPVEAHPTAGQDLDHLAVTEEELDDAVKPSENPPEEDANEGAVAGADANDDLGKQKPKKGRRILNLLKGTAKGGIQTALTADKAKAKVGAKHAKNRLGAVRGPNLWPPRGPVTFPARCKGKKGHAYITSNATTPALSWTSSIDDVNPAWTVAIADISDLKKIGGLGWKSKLMVGWATGKEVVDGMVIRTKSGEEFQLTAVTIRDDLFNRIIAMGSQMWEAW